MTGTRFTPEVHPQLPKKIARMQELANDLLDIIEKEVIPLYYQRNGHGYSEGWVRMSKNSMRTCIPKFNSLRAC